MKSGKFVFMEIFKNSQKNIHKELIYFSLKLAKSSSINENYPNKRKKITI